jgi:Uri superfamily endonuclease
MDKLPIQAGTYALILELSAAQILQVGRFGGLNFPAGNYVYLGSARGPGGIRARLGRHIHGGAKTRWHIDYLRARALVVEYGFREQSNWRLADEIPLECQWSQEIAKLPGATTPVVKFGASDCKAGCQAHLVFFETQRWASARQFFPLRLIHHFIG